METFSVFVGKLSSLGKRSFRSTSSLGWECVPWCHRPHEIWSTSSWHFRHCLSETLAKHGDLTLTHRSWYKIRPSGAGAVALGGNLWSDMLQAKTLQLGAVWDGECVHLYEFMDVVLMKHRETCWCTSYFDLCSIFSSMRSDAWQFFQKQAKHKRVRLYIYISNVVCFVHITRPPEANGFSALRSQLVELVNC